MVSLIKEHTCIFCLQNILSRQCDKYSICFCESMLPRPYLNFIPAVRNSLMKLNCYYTGIMASMMIYKAMQTLRNENVSFQALEY